jgi:hypothetical protein
MNRTSFRSNAQGLRGQIRIALCQQDGWEQQSEERAMKHGHDWRCVSAIMPGGRPRQQGRPPKSAGGR